MDRQLMKRQNLWLFLCIGLLAFLVMPLTAMAQSDDEVHITIIHTNDIYEILPVSGGTAGGVARVATFKEQLLEENPNTFLTLSGDYHGPSGMGLAMVDGTPLAGEQTVAVLNEVGFDFVTFGDHEFDVYDVEEHLDRMAETTFPMISSNVFKADGTPFEGVEAHAVVVATNDAGAEVSIAFFGVTEPIPRVSAPVITYTNTIDAAMEQVDVLQEEADIIVALTHQAVTVDQELAQAVPEIDLILGGDEHENMVVENGEGLPTIYKSDSNVRNIQIIDLYYNTATDELRIEDRLHPITDEITDDPAVQAVADEWTEIAFDAFRAEGIEPTDVLGVPTVDLDGLASSVRGQPTEFTRILMRGIHALTTEPELSLYVSGLIRLDDIIPAGGEFTRYDSLRAFPLDTQLMTLEMSGATLEEILNLGEQSAGTGFYILKTENVTQADDGSWLINDEPLDPEYVYQVGGDFAVLGNFESMGVTLLEEHDLFASDALAHQLGEEHPAQESAASETVEDTDAEQDTEQFCFMFGTLQFCFPLISAE